MSSTHDIQQAIDAWKEADKAAAAAEKLVADASFRHFQKLGPPPSDEMVGDARMLRSLARQRLEKAMGMMNAATGTTPKKPPGGRTGN